MFTVVEVLAFSVTNYILVTEVMQLGTWGKKKKSILSFRKCMLEKPFPIFSSGNIHSEEEGEVQKVGGHLLA